MNAGGRLLSGGGFFVPYGGKASTIRAALCPLPNSPYLCKRFSLVIIGLYHGLIEMFCGRSLFVGGGRLCVCTTTKSAFQASTRKARRRKDGKQARKGRFSFVCCILSPFACNVSECNEKQRHGRYLRVKGAIC